MQTFANQNMQNLQQKIMLLIRMQETHIFMSVTHDQMVMGHTHESFAGRQMATVAAQYRITILLLGGHPSNPMWVSMKLYSFECKI